MIFNNEGSKDARMILNNKPDLNNREEQADRRKYLVWINLLYFISVRFCHDKYNRRDYVISSVKVPYITVALLISIIFIYVISKQG